MLRAWAAWETGERVTTAGAMTATVFHVGEGSRVDARAPLLTCDAPDRSDNGSLDVQCAVGNTTGDVHVRATLDGAELAPLTVDTRYRIAPLPAGAHALVLELVDARGTAVPGVFNRVERRVTAR